MRTYMLVNSMPKGGRAGIRWLEGLAQGVPEAKKNCILGARKRLWSHICRFRLGQAQKLTQKKPIEPSMHWQLVEEKAGGMGDRR
jgi:hypothetical protein